MARTQMRQYVYDPPAGSPPLEFHYDGGPVYFMPPDQYWKRAVEERVIGVKLDYTGNVRFEKKRPLTKWVPDEEKTGAALATGKIIDNTLWLSSNQYRALMSGKYSPLNQYVKAVQDVDAKYRKTTAEREAEHVAELEAIRKMHERQKQEIQNGALREIQEMRASFKGVLKATADELGVETAALEDALKKHRQQTKSGTLAASREGRREAREIVESAQQVP